jgi:hypothetical protein
VPRTRIASAARRIKGLRLTHAIAGPVAGRTLAEQGRMSYASITTTTSNMIGFTTTQMSGKNPAILRNEICENPAKSGANGGYSTAFALERVADFGFSPEELASIRPGIIAVNFRCYGWDGRWFDRRGVGMLGSAVSGTAILEGENDVPAPPASAMLND